MAELLGLIGNDPSDPFAADHYDAARHAFVGELMKEGFCIVRILRDPTRTTDADDLKEFEKRRRAILETSRYFHIYHEEELLSFLVAQDLKCHQDLYGSNNVCKVVVPRAIVETAGYTNPPDDVFAIMVRGFGIL